jgi:hypothetical protein
MHQWGGKPEMERSFDLFVAPVGPCVAGAEKVKTYHFRPLFLWFISFGGAKEMNNLIVVFLFLKKQYLCAINKHKPPWLRRQDMPMMSLRNSGR